MGDTKQPILWGVGDEEQLREDPEYAIEYCLDNFLDPKMTGVEVLQALPETVELVGYSRMEVSPPGYMADRLVEEILEYLDEDYGGEDPSEPTEAMKRAAETFIDAVVKEYVPWACEPVSSQTINVAEWVRKNRPEWLEDPA